MMLHYMVLLSICGLIVEGRLDIPRDLSAASPAQIRFAIENRFDDTGPGAKEPERAHKMFKNLDEALAAYLNDPDTKLSDGDKVRAFRALVNSPHNQQIPTFEKGAYKLLSFNPNGFKFDIPTYATRPPQNHAWTVPTKWQGAPAYHVNHAKFQESKNQFRNTNYAQVELPFNDHSLKHNVEPYKEVYHKLILNQDDSLNQAFNSQRLQHIHQAPISANVFWPDHRFSTTKQPNFLDLQKAVIQAEKQIPVQDRLSPIVPRNGQMTYAYAVQEPKTGDWKSVHETHHQNGAITGQYSLRDADGKTRVVRYTANDDGFKATVDRSRGEHYMMN